jgi:hypothetical protein
MISSQRDRTLDDHTVHLIKVVAAPAPVAHWLAAKRHDDKTFLGHCLARGDYLRNRLSVLLVLL